MSSVILDSSNFGSYVAILFVSSVIPFIMIMWGLLASSEVYLVIAFFFKLSFFPFLWWFPYLSSFLTFFLFFVFGVINKIFPVILLFINQIISFNVIFLISLLTIVLSLINLMYFQNDIKIFLAWSSNANFGWMILVMSQVWIGGLVYFFLYLSLLFYILVCFSDSNTFFDQLNNSGYLEKLFFFFLLISFLGLPPFFGFFYKYVFINSVVGFDFLNNSTVILVFIIVLVTINSFIYINLLFKINMLSFFFFLNKWFFLVLVFYLFISAGFLSL
uniref:NADH dehydrogenase subunit 2 n=1 Tax=Bipalium admarginatum TaxID=3023024 RepID=UPI0024115CA1|nr:NADH dehydrogenase subunit 2 [Bipalium admarginatum]WEM34735.1 NADH dehydrogenase subunit 2 [Bipalium admarginatum]